MCYCCRNKRKKVYKILLNESMKVIIEKLDISNIFRNICSIECYSNNEVNKYLNIINMSNKCTKDLSEIMKYENN